jgi:thymidylate kinase
VRAGTRMAVRGLIVICDRWPQPIEPGLMDGPTKPRSGNAETWLRKWELLLYERMARYRPDVTIHLTGEYANSAARKPGELTREEFDKRIALMAESRRRDPSIHVVDASGDIDEVSRALFKLIWSKL